MFVGRLLNTPLRVTVRRGLRDSLSVFDRDEKFPVVLRKRVHSPEVIKEGTRIVVTEPDIQT